ncbi:MAG: hypothetical protein WHS88_11150 [Anaerohalosphaeraceae bacterium]
MNNLHLMPPEHWLMEFRIDLSEKPAGLQDPSEIYKRLSEWLSSHGYDRIDNYQECFDKNDSGDYSQMETTIMVPVEKR